MNILNIDWIFDEIKALMLIFSRSEQSIVVMFFVFVFFLKTKHLSDLLYRWNDLMSGIYFKIIYPRGSGEVGGTDKTRLVMSS